MKMSFDRLIRRIVFRVGRDAFHGPPIGTLRQYRYVSYAKGCRDSEPFSLIHPKRIKKPLCETASIPPSTSYKILAPGMIVLRKYVSLKDQVDIVNMCEKWAMGPAGFYQASFEPGADDYRHHMCFGRNWDVERKRYTSDGPEPPLVPNELRSLAETAIQDAQAHLAELPSMCPDTCLVSFYPPDGRYALHQDQDESSDSVQRGLPVVSVTIGDAPEFLFRYTGAKNKVHDVVLYSGDVLIFGGKSRLIKHGVRVIYSDLDGLPVSRACALKSGSLNLTLRQF